MKAQERSKGLLQQFQPPEQRGIRPIVFGVIVFDKPEANFALLVFMCNDIITKLIK